MSVLCECCGSCFKGSRCYNCGWINTNKEWYMAMDKNRKWHLFTAKPVRFEKNWLVCEGEGDAYSVDKNFPKAENWKESRYKLVKEG